MVAIAVERVVMKVYEKIAVLGAGSFGVALSKMAAAKAQEVILWGRNEQVIQAINKTHHHPYSLSQILLPKSIRATLDLKEALRDASVVFLTLPLEAMTEVLLRANEYLLREALLVSTAKGITQAKLYLPSDIIKHTVSEAHYQRALYLSGPSFAIELAEGLPTAMTIASLLRPEAQHFQKSFGAPNCRLYYTSDVIGVLVGGALKNVIAIAAGVCSELQLGKNAQASLITRGLAEMARLAKKMGGHPQTLMGLSGVGDLVLSATDGMSRNFRLGTLLAQGYNKEQSLKLIGAVVEGANTAQAIVPLMEHYDVEMPISHAVYQVLYQGMPPLEGIESLLMRNFKDEHTA